MLICLIHLVCCNKRYRLNSLGDISPFHTHTSRTFAHACIDIGIENVKTMKCSLPTRTRHRFTRSTRSTRFNATDTVENAACASSIFDCEPPSHCLRSFAGRSSENHLFLTGKTFPDECPQAESKLIFSVRYRVLAEFLRLARMHSPQIINFLIKFNDPSAISIRFEFSLIHPPVSEREFDKRLPDNRRQLIFFCRPEVARRRASGGRQEQANAVTA